MDYSTITIVFFQVVSILLLSTTIVSFAFVPKALKKEWNKKGWMVRSIWVTGNAMGLASLIYLVV